MQPLFFREYNRVDRDRVRAIEREERDRRRLEAVHAKKYPIDDLELVAEQRRRTGYHSGSASKF